MTFIYPVASTTFGDNVINPFEPEFTIVIFIHYKPLIFDL